MIDDLVKNNVFVIEKNPENLESFVVEKRPMSNVIKSFNKLIVSQGHSIRDKCSGSITKQVNVAFFIYNGLTIHYAIAPDTRVNNPEQIIRDYLETFK